MNSNQEHGRFFKALADPFRLQIIRALPCGDITEDQVNVNRLVKQLGGSQPNMSHHLGVLKNAGILKYEKIRNSTYFYVDEAWCRRWIEQFEEDYLNKQQGSNNDE